MCVKLISATAWYLDHVSLELLKKRLEIRKLAECFMLLLDTFSKE
jgi:hypothetical protein